MLTAALRVYAVGFLLLAYLSLSTPFLIYVSSTLVFDCVEEEFSILTVLLNPVYTLSVLFVSYIRTLSHPLT